jgi:hypothetical protein
VTNPSGYANITAKHASDLESSIGIFLSEPISLRELPPYDPPYGFPAGDGEFDVAEEI